MILPLVVFMLSLACNLTNEVYIYASETKRLDITQVTTLYGCQAQPHPNIIHTSVFTSQPFISQPLLNYYLPFQQSSSQSIIFYSLVHLGRSLYSLTKYMQLDSHSIQIQNWHLVLPEEVKKAHIIVDQDYMQLLFQDSQNVSVYLFVLGGERMIEPVSRLTLASSFKAFQVYQANNLRSASRLYSVSIDNLTYFMEVKVNERLALGTVMSDVVDFFEMSDWVIYYLYRDRFELYSVSLHKVYSVYTNKQFSLAKHQNVQFSYDYVNGFLVIQQKSQVIILQKYQEEFILFKILELKAIKIIINKSFLIIFLLEYVMYFDLIHQEINNIWQHNYSAKTLSQVTLNQIQFGEKIIEMFLIKDNQNVNQLVIGEQFIIISKVTYDFDYYMQCQQYTKEWDGNIVPSVKQVVFKIILISDKVQIVVKDRVDNIQYLQTQHKYLIYLNDYFQGKYLYYQVSLDKDQILMNEQFTYKILKDEKIYQSVFDNIFVNNIFINQFVISQRQLVFIQQKNYTMNIYYCNLQMNNCELYQTHTQFQSKICKLKFIINSQNQNVFLRFNKFQTKDQQLLKNLYTYFYFGVLFTKHPDTIFVYGLRQQEQYFKKLQIQNFDSNIDKILDFRGIFMDGRVQIFIVQQLTKQIFSVDAFGHGQKKNHIIDLKFINKFMNLTFFQPEAFIVLDHYNLLGKQNYFAIKDKVSIFILEYNQKHQIFLVTKRIVDDCTKYKGQIEPFIIKIFQNYIAVINQHLMKIHFYDSQNMDEIFLECNKSTEVNGFDYLYSSQKNGFLIIQYKMKIYIKNVNSNLDYNYGNIDIDDYNYRGYLQDNDDDSTNLYIYNANQIITYKIQKNPQIQLEITNSEKDKANNNKVKYTKNATLVIKSYSYSDYEIRTYSQNQTIAIVFLDTSIKLLNPQKNSFQLSRIKNGVRFYPLDILQGVILDLKITCYNCVDSQSLTFSNNIKYSAFISINKLIKSFVIKDRQTLILDIDNNLYIFIDKALKETFKLGENYKVKIQSGVVYVLNYQTMSIQYYDFNKEAFIKPNLQIYPGTFYDVSMIKDTFYIQYKLYNQVLINQINMNKQDGEEEERELVLRDAITADNIFIFGILQQHQMTVFVYQNIINKSQISIIVQQTTGDLLSSSVDLQSFPSLYDYSSSLVIHDLKVLTLSKNNTSISITFLVIFVSYYSLLVEANVSLDNNYSQLVGCMYRYNESSDIVNMTLVPESQQLYLVSQQDTSVWSQYDLKYSMTIYTQQQTCVFPNISMKVQDTDRLIIAVTALNQIVINTGNLLSKLTYTPYIDIDDFNQQQDLSLKIQATGVQNFNQYVKIINSVQKKSLLQKYWTIVVILVLIVIAMGCSYVLIKKRRREVLLEAKFIL